MHMSDEALRTLRGLTVAKIAELEEAAIGGIVPLDPIVETTRRNMQMTLSNLREGLAAMNVELQRRKLMP